MHAPPLKKLLCRDAVRRAAAVTLLLLAHNAAAGPERWHSLTAVPKVTVYVHWVSTAELRGAAHRYGRQPKSKPTGFAVLKWNPAAGELVCELYLTTPPTRLGDRATMTLGHEMAHCLGFSHRPGSRDSHRSHLVSEVP